MEHIYILLPKYFNNQCTSEESQMIENWKKENPAEFEAHETIWSQSENHEYIDFDADTAWKELQPKLKDDASTTKIVSMSPWYKMAAAAVVLLVCTWAVMQWSGSTTDDSLFAEGLNKEFSTTATKGKEISTQTGTLATALASNDKIWLNKNSKVEDLGDKNGRYGVKLVAGEAFFEVNSRKANPNQAFLVHTSNAVVTVVGTAFSVITENEKTIIRVVEGVVKVAASDIQSITLTEGQEAYIIDGGIQKMEKFNQNLLAWKTGKFEFKETALDKVALLLQSFYDVKIEVAPNLTSTTNGNFDNENIDVILNAIALSSSLKLETVEAGKHYRIGF